MASLSTPLARYFLPSTTQLSVRIEGSKGTRFAILQNPHFFRLSRSLRISCEAAPPAKPETLKKVIEIVTKQLAAGEGSVQPHSKFQDLGADSLDQVEIVMALEEEFKISVDEDGAESIVTVQDAANLIEKVL